MFGRKNSKVTPEEAFVKEGGKGHPTPTRKEAEADRKARAKASASGVDPRKSSRQQRMAQSRVAREGFARGEERYLPPRDRGPMRRYLRDLIDSRIHISEMLMPLLILYMIFYFVGLTSLASAVWTTTIVFVAGDLAWLSFQARRQLRDRFPGQSTRGTVNYIFMRAIQIRPLRRPKPRIKLGDSLDDQNYR